jgi:hypothetical protein
MTNEVQNPKSKKNNNLTLNHLVIHLTLGF